RFDEPLSQRRRYIQRHTTSRLTIASHRCSRGFSRLLLLFLFFLWNNWNHYIRLQQRSNWRALCVWQRDSEHDASGRTDIGHLRKTKPRAYSSQLAVNDQRSSQLGPRGKLSVSPSIIAGTFVYVGSGDRIAEGKTGGRIQHQYGSGHCSHAVEFLSGQHSVDRASGSCGDLAKHFDDSCGGLLVFEVVQKNRARPAVVPDRGLP